MITLPVALQAHLNSGASTVCVLLKITPVRLGYATFGVTDLDRNVYLDGVTYYAAIGADLSAWQTTNSMGVDNAETTGLMPTWDLSLDEEAFRAGAYDYAKWEARLVNYNDLSMGSPIIRSGEFGQVRLVNGLTWTAELLGLSQRLQQNIVRQATRSCPAIFGSQPIGTIGAEVTERYPCGKNTSGMSVGGKITSISSDPSFVLNTNLAEAAGTFRPGLIKFTTGKNAGRSYEVELHATGGVLTLLFPLAYAVAVDDEFAIRADCTHLVEGANGCKFHHSTVWVNHYRGDPLMPVGEQSRLNSPGASG